MLAIGFGGSLVSTFSVNYPMLLPGRCLHGLASAILPLCVGLVRENLPPKKVPMGIGLMISGASAGTACGPVIGGMMVDHFSWHGIFFASALFAATAFAAIYLALPKSPRIVIEWRLDCIVRPRHLRPAARDHQRPQMGTGRLAHGGDGGSGPDLAGFVDMDEPAHR